MDIKAHLRKIQRFSFTAFGKIPTELSEHTQTGGITPGTT